MRTASFLFYFVEALKLLTVVRKIWYNKQAEYFNKLPHPQLKTLR